MAARGDERTSYKRAVGQTIKRSQLTDAIEEQNGNLARNRGVGWHGVGRGRTIGSPADLRRSGNRQGRAPNKSSVRLMDIFGSRSKLLRLSWSKNQQRVGILALQRSKSDERQRFFGSHDASSDDQRGPRAAFDLRLQPIRERRGRRKLGVVFQISNDRYAIRRRAESVNALGILLTLHQKGGRMRKRILQKRPQPHPGARPQTARHR